MTNAPSKIAGVLLAAGSSARFGSDKLAAPLGGETVLGSSAKALIAVGLPVAIAVVGEKTRIHAPMLAALGCVVVENREPHAGVSASVRAGVLAASEQGADAVLIALADMPYLPTEHFTALIERYLADPSVVAFSMNAGRRSPPAIFGRRWFETLSSLVGDAGARHLLAASPFAAGVEAPSGALRDIDRPEDVA